MAGPMIVATLTYLIFRKALNTVTRTLLDFMGLFVLFAAAFPAVWKLVDMGIYVFSLWERIDMVALGLFCLFHGVSLILFFTIFGVVRCVVFLKDRIGGK